MLPLSYLFDHAGPITRTVEDAALMLNAIAGYDPADATTVRTPVDDYTRELGAGLRGLRIGVPRAYFFAQLDDEVAAAVESAIAELRRLGADVRDVEIAGVEDGVGALFGLVLAEAQEIHAELAAHAARRLRCRRARAARPSRAPDAMSLMLALRARATR